jgi:hypothetical protein
MGGKHLAAVSGLAPQFAFIVLRRRCLKQSACTAPKVKTNNINGKNGAPERIRTSDP